METATLPNDNLCFVTVVFPVSSDDEAIRIKAKFAAVLAELPRVKIDFRIVQVKDNGNLGHQTSGSELPG